MSVSPADKTTTINGRATRFTANNVNQFAIDLGDGNDRLNIANAVVRGNVAIDLGEDSGSDMLTVSFSRISGALSVTTGDGTDRLAISGATVSGATRIDIGCRRRQHGLECLSIQQLAGGLHGRRQRQSRGIRGAGGW